MRDANPNGLAPDSHYIVPSSINMVRGMWPGRAYSLLAGAVRRYFPLRSESYSYSYSYSYCVLVHGDS